METLLLIALILVGVALGVVAIISGIINIVLFFKYIKYNRTPNSANKTGVEVAQEILDYKGIHDIKVKTGGSLIFGNSYSHYFKKIRLRRLTRNKTSITAMAMGSQKASLAILDKQGDKDMKRYVRRIPITILGTFAFIPLILIGFALDMLVFKTEGLVSLIVAIVGIIFYIIVVILSFSALRSEKKAQQMACQLLVELNMATDNEIVDMQNLFKLYNIQYINDIITSILELIKEVLKLLLKILQIFGKKDK